MTIPAHSQTPWLRPARRHFYAQGQVNPALKTEINPTPGLREIWHVYRRQIILGAGLGLAFGVAIKPLAALCLIVAMAVNAL